MCALATRRLRCRLALVVLCLFTTGSCSRHPMSDAQMIAAFQHNRSSFAHLVITAYSQPPVCRFQNEPNSCEPQGARALKRELSHMLQFSVEGIYIDRKQGALRIPIESYGILATGSTTRGYMYCNCSLGPITQDTLDEVRNGIWYRSISDGWALFVIN